MHKKPLSMKDLVDSISDDDDIAGDTTEVSNVSSHNATLQQQPKVDTTQSTSLRYSPHIPIVSVHQAVNTVKRSNNFSDNAELGINDDTAKSDVNSFLKQNPNTAACSKMQQPMKITGLNDQNKDMKSSHKSTSEVVDKHPLARSSSGSSSSSVELDSNVLSYRKSPQRSMKGRVSSKGRLRDFINKFDDEPVEASEVGGYYQSASALWHNRSKIFAGLKKQATDGVRSLTQSTSADSTLKEGVFAKTTDSTVVSDPEDFKLPLSTSHSGLIKVETENITESNEDVEVSSFLQGLKDKVSDPLNVLLKKKEEEQQQKEDEEFYDDLPVKQRFRSHTALSANDSGRYGNKGRELGRLHETPPSWRPSSDKSSSKKSFTVSLSALLAGREKNAEDSISDDVITVTDEEVTNHQERSANIPSDSDGTRIDETNADQAAEDSSDLSNLPSVIEGRAVIVATIAVYLYFVVAVPPFIQAIVISFLCGSALTGAFLCIVAPRSRRPTSFLPNFVNSKIPTKIPKSIFDPEKPIKGWMNELFSYDPDTYHVSGTQTVFVTLDGATLRLQTPQKCIARRSVHGEGNIPVSNVIQQRMYDLTTAKVYLKPPGLVKKRVWSKKYPICVEFSPQIENKEEPAIDVTGTAFEEGVMKTASTSEPSSSKNIECLYLFGRTDRQKEEWFYRIQRHINLSLFRQKKNLQGNAEKDSLGLLNDTSIKDEWGIIENHYEKETFVASSLCDVTKINDEPLRAIQDYFVHVSRLLPDEKQHAGSKPDRTSRHNAEAANPSRSESSGRTFNQPGLEVAWLNAVIGRVTFDFLRQPTWARWLSNKIQKKLDKIKLPYFMDELKLTEMNLGSTVPLIHQMSLPKLDSQGVWLDMEVTYSGSLQMTLSTKLVLTKLGKKENISEVDKQRTYRPSAITDSDAEDSAESSDDEDESAVSRVMGQVQTAVSKLDGQQLIKDAIKHVGNEPVYSSTRTPTPSAPSGSAPPKKWVRIVDKIANSKYFQKAAESDYIRKKLETVSNTPVLLTVEVLELSGVLAVNIPPPPTDRIWYGFRDPPLMLLKAQPKVGERVVKTTHVTDWIEHKLQQEFVKVLVMPNMDDIPVPIMFNNRPPT